MGVIANYCALVYVCKVCGVAIMSVTNKYITKKESLVLIVMGWIFIALLAIGVSGSLFAISYAIGGSL